MPEFSWKEEQPDTFQRLQSFWPSEATPWKTAAHAFAGLTSGEHMYLKTEMVQLPTKGFRTQHHFTLLYYFGLIELLICLGKNYMHRLWRFVETAVAPRGMPSNNASASEGAEYRATTQL